ncbi:MAG TPA: hypothetical protein VM075_06825 [Anaerolineae bacterium]|nr:hypothetical protein [Anaerolineae bacterium]
MTYKERVREKIASGTARREERSQLWEEITKAYEEGSIEQVESALTAGMADITLEFRHLLEKLEHLL